jgi:serine/threonine-protein kinase
MLTGQRPFQSDSLVALALKIANEQPIPIERLRKDLPSSLRRVVSRCLAKSPDRRFQTGRELADALARVLAQIDEATGKREKPRLVPLRVKWAATMALIVAVVMAVSATVITQRQVGAMMGQVTDYGASVARFIAAQNAVAALSEDWPVVDVAVQEIMKTGDFQNVTVIDREGIVRADADPSLTGKTYRAPAVKASERRKDGVTVSRFGPKEEPILGFEAPITFQGKVVGNVALAIAERPLVRVARLSMGLMAALVVITVLAVAIAMYFVGNWFAQPIRVVSEALDEITKGRLDHRIAEQRNDEFGLLFTAFDRMATSLQDRHDTVGVSSTEPDSLLPRVESGASEETPSASGGASMARPSVPSVPSSVRSL